MTDDTPRPGARTKRGPIVEATLRASLRAGGGYGYAAAAAGIDVRTLYRWRQEDPEFAATLARCRAEPEGRALAVINKAMDAVLTGGDPEPKLLQLAIKAAEAILRRDPEFREQHAVEVDYAPRPVIVVPERPGSSPAEVDAWAARCRVRPPDVN